VVKGSTHPTRKGVGAVRTANFAWARSHCDLNGVLPGSQGHLDLRHMSTQQLSTATDAGESFAAMFAASIEKQDMKSGEVISAEVVRIDHNFVVVNAGLKSEALIPLEEFLNDQGELEVKPGDFVSVAIDSLENGYGDTVLSRDRAKRLSAWLSLEKSLEKNELVTGTITR
jgi:small subunit ribosomal protein S1